MKKFDERRLGMIHVLADDLMDILLRGGCLPPEVRGEDVRIIGGEYSPTGRLTLFIEGDTLPEEFRYSHQGIRSVAVNIGASKPAVGRKQTFTEAAPVDKAD
jgi:hypothetical protein